MKEMDMMRKTLMMAAAAAALVVPVVAAPAASAAPAQAPTVAPTSAAARSGPFFQRDGSVVWRETGRVGRGPRLAGLKLTVWRHPNGALTEAITVPYGCKAGPTRIRKVRGGHTVSQTWSCHRTNASPRRTAGAWLMVPAWRQWV